MVLRHLTIPNKVAMLFKPSSFRGLIPRSIAGRVALAAGVGVITYAASQCYTAYRWVLPTEDEVVMRGLAELVDDGIVPPEDDEFVEGGIFGNLFEEGPPAALPANDRYTQLARVKGWRRNRVKWVVKAALLAKAKFGTLQDTPPNREMLSDYVRKQMVEHGLRPTHIAQQYPLAVALALLPSQTDVMLNTLLSTGIAEQRLRDANGTWRHREIGVHIDRILFGRPKTSLK